MPTRFVSAEEYIDSFPEQIAERLRTVRRIARDVLPDAGERISYGIPAVTRDGRDVVYYSGWRRHVAIYPVPHGDESLDHELDAYRAGKGTLQFRHDRPLPEDLVRRVVAALADSRTTRPEPRKEPRP
jgi:uncharacterized protein YdhG (YjbR/CyaY superfamily)